MNIFAENLLLQMLLEKNAIIEALTKKLKEIEGSCNIGEGKKVKEVQNGKKS